MELVSDDINNYWHGKEIYIFKENEEDELVELKDSKIKKEIDLTIPMFGSPPSQSNDQN